MHCLPGTYAFGHQVSRGQAEATRNKAQSITVSQDHKRCCAMKDTGAGADAPNDAGSLPRRASFSPQSSRRESYNLALAAAAFSTSETSSTEGTQCLPFGWAAP
eukprot:scaffold22621_cov24-Tisochrysis_lutea.AAC.1